MSTAAGKTKDQITRLVSPFIEQYQPDDYRFQITEVWFSRGLDAWIVAVDVDREGVSGIDYAKRLVDIEEIVQQQTGQEIHVHPATYRED